MSHFGVIVQLAQIIIINIFFSVIIEKIYKVNDEIIDYFRHLSDIYYKTADFVNFFFILYFSSYIV